MVYVDPPGMKRRKTVEGTSKLFRSLAIYRYLFKFSQSLKH